MKAIFKKTAAFAASAMLAAALAVPTMTASASDMWADFVTSAQFTKEVVVQAEEQTGTVAAPVVSYSYVIEPLQEADVTGKTVTDKSGNTVGVKPGKTGGLTIGTDNSATFSGTQTLSDGKAVFSDTVGVATDFSKFGAPGVYRYKVTETADPAELATVGIARPANYDPIRYIDVYVNSTEVYGIVMFAAGEPGDEVNSTATKKSVGYTDSSQDTEQTVDPTTGLADVYFLYNYTVEKKVENSALLTAPTFSFTVTMTGVEGQKYDDGTKEVATPVTAELGDGDKIELKNIPANVTISVSEKNTSQATYDVTAADSKLGSVELDNASLAVSGTSGFKAAAALSNIASAADASAVQKSLDTTTFTNKQVDISPTGLVFMIAPFVIMLSAGAFLFGLFTKNRKKDDAESII